PRRHHRSDRSAANPALDVDVTKPPQRRAAPHSPRLLRRQAVGDRTRRHPRRGTPHRLPRRARGGGRAVTDLHLPSFIAGAIVGPFLWASVSFLLILILAVVGDVLEGLVNR